MFLISKDKCRFAKTTVKFLGDVIGPEGICPDPDKVQPKVAQISGDS